MGAQGVETVDSSDGTSIAWYRSGDGLPLVLVHGTAADHARWAPVLPAFERHFAVLAVDRRGRGASGDAPTYTAEREFENIAAVVDRAGAETTVLGHSYGAMCALPGCSVVVMPGQGHVAMDTGTQLFTGNVLRFLGIDAAEQAN